MAVRYIRMRNGYVESNTNSVLEFYHDEGFPTRYEALQNLAEAMYRAYVYEFGESVQKSCCNKYFEQGKAFCADCGQKIGSFHQRWPDIFFGYIADLHHSVTDGTHNVWESLQDYGWDFHGVPFGITQEETLCIGAYGAEALYLAAYDIDWEDDTIRDHFRDYVLGDTHELPYWWWREDSCNSKIGKFINLVNKEGIY